MGDGGPNQSVASPPRPSSLRGPFSSLRGMASTSLVYQRSGLTAAVALTAVRFDVYQQSGLRPPWLHPWSFGCPSAKRPSAAVVLAVRVMHSGQAHGGRRTFCCYTPKRTGPHQQRPRTALLMYPKTNNGRSHGARRPMLLIHVTANVAAATAAAGRLAAIRKGLYAMRENCTSSTQVRNHYETE